MSLSVGARLGHYEVTAKLGEGGMGEVCRRGIRSSTEMLLALFRTTGSALADKDWADEA